MLPRRDPSETPKLTRRALAGRVAGAAATIGLGTRCTVATAATAMDPVLRDAALRGLALADHRGDPVASAAAAAALEGLATPIRKARCCVASTVR
ncbi:hypothetical protein [Pseudorhodobacter sp.]|uniref:hypothetical protein n=1 Tax=Pseudorhodobacter sp. TaxID=1934400 RepID=UPI002649D8F5|nr:hypothetical protein [Pseudorhodobacter sp.]MDN5785808.1 hypothetical protein [Pseudorhodobacter sp.]